MKGLWVFRRTKKLLSHRQGALLCTVTQTQNLSYCWYYKTATNLYTVIKMMDIVKCPIIFNVQVVFVSYKVSEVYCTQHII